MSERRLLDVETYLTGESAAGTAERSDPTDRCTQFLLIGNTPGPFSGGYILDLPQTQLLSKNPMLGSGPGP